MRFILSLFLIITFSASAKLGKTSSGGTSGANTALSNVASTSVGASLIPGGSFNLGSAGASWATGYFDTVKVGVSGIGSLHIQNTGSIKGILTTDIDRPSGGTPDWSITTSTGSQSMSIFTADSASNNATATGMLTLESGNKTAGTGNSGSVIIRTGTSLGGSRGMVIANALTFQIITTETKPTCAVGFRGSLYVTQSGAGVADKLEVCVKDAGDSYAWTALY